MHQRQSQHILTPHLHQPTKASQVYSKNYSPTCLTKRKAPPAQKKAALLQQVNHSQDHARSKVTVIKIQGTEVAADAEITVHDKADIVNKINATVVISVKPATIGIIAVTTAANNDMTTAISAATIVNIANQESIANIVTDQRNNTRRHLRIRRARNNGSHHLRLSVIQ
jgi:hypothetical protein